MKYETPITIFIPAIPSLYSNQTMYLTGLSLDLGSAKSLKTSTPGLSSSKDMYIILRTEYL